VPDGGDRILSSPTRPDSPGDLWHNTNTGTIVRLVEGGPPDELIYEAGGSVGDNRLLDIDYEGFAAGLGGWYVAILKDLMPRYPPRVVLGNAAGGGVGEGTASLNAPTNPSYTRYSATSGALVWNAVPASAVVGGPFRYRVRREGVSDVILEGRSTSNMTVDSFGPDEIIHQVRLERISDGAFSEWLEITRPAEPGGNSGGNTGATNLTAPDRAQWWLRPLLLDGGCAALERRQCRRRTGFGVSIPNRAGRALKRSTGRESGQVDE